MKTPEESEAINKRVIEIANELQALVGKDGAAIVMVGFTQGEDHSGIRWSWRGRCLQARGLLEKGYDEVKTDIWKTKP